MSTRNNRTYTAWCNMRTRCGNPNYKDAQYYSELDIEVCADWHYYEGFLRDMGECPKGLTLDRRDNAKGYYKENCRWATAEEQSRNRSNVKLTEEKVRLIKGLLRSIRPGTAPRQADLLIGKAFSVSAAVISRIRLGYNWSSVP